jgi:hypothetical protein
MRLLTLRNQAGISTQNMPPLHFVVFIAVSALVFIGILRWILRNRPRFPAWQLVSGVALIVVIAGMCFAKFGATQGFPWPVYYGVPALITLLLPPLAFRMCRHEFVQYVLLAFLSSPLIHATFSFLIGWHEYLPFWHIPSVWQLVSTGA